MPSPRRWVSFLLSGLEREMGKPCAPQISRRTAARASAKVGHRLLYQAAPATARRLRLLSSTLAIWQASCGVAKRVYHAFADA